MPRLVVIRQLNYTRPLHPSTVGQQVGPDAEGRMFTVTEVNGREAVLEWSTPDDSQPATTADSRRTRNSRRSARRARSRRR